MANESTDFWSIADQLLELVPDKENDGNGDDNQEITVEVIELTAEQTELLTAHGVKNIPGLR